jgi:hypothetical protein
MNNPRDAIAFEEGYNDLYIERDSTGYEFRMDNTWQGVSTSVYLTVEQVESLASWILHDTVG